MIQIRYIYEELSFYFAGLDPTAALVRVVINLALVEALGLAFPIFSTSAMHNL